MANFNDFLNTKSDPMQSDLTKNTISTIQGTQFETPNKTDINVKPEEVTPTPLSDTDKLSLSNVSEPKESNLNAANLSQEQASSMFQNNIKTLKAEDINRVLPDYSKINPEDYKTTNEYLTAQAKESYAAHVKQIEQDAKYYLTNNGGKYSTKLPQDYALAYLENEKRPNDFKWDRYAMMQHFEKPIYQYGKESHILSFAKGATAFLTNMVSSTGRVLALPSDVSKSMKEYASVQGNDAFAQVGRDILGVNDDDSDYNILNKTLGSNLEYTTKSFRDINQQLDMSLGIGVDEKTNPLSYQLGQAAGNVAAMFATLGVGSMMKTVQAANAIRNVAGNLVCGMYGAAAFQSYALDSMQAGKDPLKSHAAATVNGILNVIVEGMQWKFVKARIGNGAYKSPTEMLKAYKTMGAEVFTNTIYKDSVAAGMLSEGFEEGIQQSIEHALKIFQGIEDDDAAAIVADIAQSMLLGAVMSWPMSHIATRSQFKARNHIAQRFVNVNEDDALALSMVFVAHGENLAKDEAFQKEFVNFLRDNIINLKPADAGQDTDPTTDSGIMQELGDGVQNTLGNDNFDTMLLNGKNLKNNLFDLLTNKKRAEELHQKMMDTTKMLKKYATKYLGQTEEEAEISAKLSQDNIFTIAVMTDMPAKQILNAIMPKVHNRSMVSALNSYKSSDEGALNILKKYRYKNNQSVDNLSASANTLKGIMNNSVSLTDIAKASSEGKDLKINDEQRSIAELKSITQREAAIQQQIRKRNGEPISYNTALDIALYKLLGANEKTIAKLFGTEYAFKNDEKHAEKRTKQVLSSIDTTNDDFLGIESFNTAKISRLQQIKGDKKAALELANTQAELQAGLLYASRAREIINNIKENKDYKLTKEDMVVLNNALKLADMQDKDNSIYGLHVVSEQINPLIILNRVISRETSIHEFFHHIGTTVVALNNYMKDHTGYHFVYYNNLVNGINHLFKAVYGKELSIVDANGQLNEEASELFANILEDYVSGKLKLDDEKFTDIDRQVLDSVIDSYNNAIRASETPSSGIKEGEQKQTADKFIANNLLKKSAFSNVSLSNHLINKILDMLSNENLTGEEMLANLKAIYQVAKDSNLLSFPLEQAFWITNLENDTSKKLKSKLSGDIKTDYYIIATNLLSDISNTAIENTVSEEGPEQDVKAQKGALSGGKGKKSAILLPKEFREKADKIISETLKQTNKNLTKSTQERNIVAEMLIPSTSERLTATGEKLSKVLTNSTLKAIKNSPKQNKNLVKLGRLITEKALLINELNEDLSNGNISQEEYNEELLKINKNYDSDIKESQDSLVKFISSALGNNNNIIKNLDNIADISKNIAAKVINDFVENNKQQFEKEFNDKNVPDTIESEAQEVLQGEKDIVKGPQEETLSLYDKREGVRYIFNKERVNEYFANEKEEEIGAYGRLIDLLYIGQDKLNEAKDKGEITETPKEFKVNFKLSQQENYDNAKNKLAETKDKESGKKGKDVMTPTELENASQEIINEQYLKKENIKDINSVIVIKDESFKSKVRDMANKVNKAIANFTDLEPRHYFFKGWEWFKDVFAVSSERLKKIGGFNNDYKNILSAYRMAYFKAQMASTRYMTVSNALYEKIKDIYKNENKEDEFKDFYSKLLTDSLECRQQALEYAKKEGFEKELMDVLQILNECKQLRIKWKEFRKGLKYYFPRVVKNYKELLIELMKDPDSEVGKELRAKGYDINVLQGENEDYAIMVYNSVVNKQLKNSKQRVLDVMKDKYIKFYAPLPEALNTYFKDQIDLIFRDSFFNNVKMSTKTLMNIHKAYKENPLNTTEGWYDILKQMGYLNPQNNYHNKENREIVKIIDSLFFRARSSKFVSTYRDVTSMFFISNPISALENFKDIGNIAAQFGLKETLSSMKDAWSASRKKGSTSDVMEEANILEQITGQTINSLFREITHTGLSKWSEWLRNMSGYGAMDSINKLSYIKSMLDTYKKKIAKKGSLEYLQTKRELLIAFNGNVDAANRCMEALQLDINEAKKSEDLLYFVYYKMCENYALNPAEMPYYFNTTTYGRLFYIFKNQTLRIANKYIYDYANGFRNAKTKAQKRKAFAELVKTLLYFSLCGIPVEYLKDILSGIPTSSLPDYAFYNIASYAMVSPYTMKKIGDDGLVRGTMESLLPAEAFDRILRADPSAVPLVGRPAKGAVRAISEAL